MRSRPREDGPRRYRPSSAAPPRTHHLSIVVASVFSVVLAFVEPVRVATRTVLAFAELAGSVVAVQ